MENDEESSFEFRDLELEHGLVFPSEVFRVGDVHVTPYECPECLHYDEFECEECSFFSPTDCVLLSNAQRRKELRTFLDIARERNLAYRRRQLAIRQAIFHELKMHGRPLHYTIITKILVERYSYLNPRPKGVLSLLARNPSLFVCVYEGTFQNR